MTELTKRLAFRCTEDFYNEVKEIASDKGLSYTDYITFSLWMIWLTITMRKEVNRCLISLEKRNEFR